LGGEEYAAFPLRAVDTVYHGHESISLLSLAWVQHVELMMHAVADVYEPDPGF